ncbi:MAG: ABC transporter ATP-binding protein [Chitinophagales bacterium]|nr:ABC transporter ATP-binding protein [Chitinophagales bacterium]
MEPVIRVEQLSKKYTIGRRHSGNFREAISDRIENIFLRRKNNAAEFWALKEVSFEVQKGEVIGIIGKNGAGKSTLLKILSRITEPTSGRVEMNGRVSSLLEVGTGFHPELTGRENIFMNGAILGMKRMEIKNKFEEIVSFSGIEQFIDTPVKRYSSGMYVRLAFAVAAHLEPEILIVDEVLAVGDAEFQNKCLGKMKDVSEKDGRTLLFVSHNMGAISRLCKSAMLLDNGKIIFRGAASEAIQIYHHPLSRNNNLLDSTGRSGNGKYRFSNFTITDNNGTPVNIFNTGSDVRIIVSLVPRLPAERISAYITLSIKDNFGNRLLSLASGLKNEKVNLQGAARIIWEIKKCPLSADDYLCDLYLFETAGGLDMVDYLENAFTLSIEEGDYFGAGMVQQKGRDRFFMDFKISVNEI